MTITQKLFIYMGLLVATIAIITGSANERIGVLEKTAATSAIETLLQESALQMEINAVETSTALLSYIQTKDVQYINKKNDSANDFAEWNSKYLSLVETNKEERFGLEVASLYEELNRVSNKIILLTNRSKKPGTINISKEQTKLLNTFNKKAEDIDKLLDEEIVFIIKKRIQSNQNKIKEIAYSANIIIFFMGISGLLIATASGWGISQEILRPISILIEGTEKIGEGNLSHRLEIEGNNEFAKLGDSFNNMSGNLKRINEELINSKHEAEAATLAKSEFLGNMTHELRTPLTHIIGFSELALSDLEERGRKEDDSLKEYLDTVYKSSKDLLVLINDILKVTSVEVNQSSGFEEGNVDIKTIVRVSAEAIKRNIIGHGKKMTTEIGDNIPDIILADENKLKLILSNLLSNAEKFTPKGGEIIFRLDRVNRKEAERFNISTEAGDEFLIFSIKDTGIGLKDCDLARIFNRFEQVDGATTRCYGGTGLGLFLAKKLTELHNGKIKAESEGKDKGSTFSLVIPLKLSKTKIA